MEVQARGGGLVEPRREGHSHGTRVGGPPRGIPGGLATLDCGLKDIMELGEWCYPGREGGTRSLGMREERGAEEA